MAITQLAVCTDSFGRGDYPTPIAYSAGGRGSWPELLGDYLGSIPGLGPKISTGARCIGNTEWTFTGAWGGTVSTDPFDLAPQGLGYYASGIAKIATYPIPTAWKANVGFKLYIGDINNGSTVVAGNAQYRIDGGTWTNFGQTLIGDNKILQFYVATPVTTTLEVRAYNGSADCYVMPIAIELFFVDPTTATVGIIVHEYCFDGRKLSQFVQAGSGDRMAMLDNVKNGTGSPITNKPNGGTIFEFLNDLFDNEVTTTGWAASLTTARNRAVTSGPVGFVNPYEINTGTGATSGMQSTWRAQTKTTAAAFSPASPVLDLYDAWAAKGLTGYVAGVNNGLIVTFDFIHPSQAGHFDIGPRVFWWWLKNNFSTVQGPRKAFRLASSRIGGPNDLGGNAFLDQSPAFSSIASTSALGALTLQQTAPLTAIGSTSSLGSLTEHQTAPFAGIGSTVAIGAPTFNLVASFAAVATTSMVGALTTNETAPFTAITSTSALGTLTAQQAFSFTAIAATSAVGAVTANTTAPLTGIAPTTTFGALQVNDAFSLTGIGSTTSVGTVSFAFGAVTVSLASIGATSSVGAFGSIDQQFALSGIGPTATFGTLMPAPGNVDTALTAIGSTSALGAITVLTGTAISFVGIDPTSAVGTPTFGFGAVTVTLSAIAPTSTLGVLTPAPGPVTATLASIAATSALGALSLAEGPVTTALASIGTTSSLGAISAQISDASLQSISSTLTIGVLTTSTHTIVVLNGILPTGALGTLTPGGPTPQFIPLVSIGTTIEIGHLILGGVPRAALVIALPDWSARVATVPEMACTVEAT